MPKPNTSYLSLLVCILLAMSGCDGTGAIVTDDDTGDDDTSRGDDDTSGDDDDIGDDDSNGDDDVSDDDTGDDDDGAATRVTCADISADITVPTDYAAIQTAISVSANGDVICVEAGTYAERIDFLGKAIHVIGVGGATNTILTNSGNSHIVEFQSGEGPDSILQGFTLTNNNNPNGPGAMDLYYASPKLLNLILRDNDGGYEGGGMDLSYSDATLINVVFSGNHTWYEAGALDMRDSSPTLKNVVFADNHADHEGGGINMRRCYATFENVVFVGNTTVGVGAAVKMRASDPQFTNVIMVDNLAAQEGGGLGFGTAGGPSNPTLSHCNLWGNSPDNYGSMADQTGIAGNVAVDPGFMDLSNPDPLYRGLHLSAGSPSIDAGAPGLLDPDGSISDQGVFGGPLGDTWDLDQDGYPSWWLPGPYDPLTSPGMDCDDLDPAVYPGSGC